MKNILHIDASGRSTDSVSRKLSDTIVNSIKSDSDSLVYRDVSSDLPFVNETMIGAYYTAKENRTDEQNHAIALSDTIVEELTQSNIIVIGTPMYNFGPPASLKAWADLAARVGETFRYTDTGPLGLLKNKKAYIAVATGGASVDSDVDYLMPWLRHFLGFLGIDDIEVIKAEGINREGQAAIDVALSKINHIAT